MDITKKQLAQRKRRFKELFVSPLTRQIKQVERQQANNMEAAKQAEKEIQTATAEMNAAAERIRTLPEEGGAERQALLGEEFDRLMKMPQVLGIGFSDDRRRLLAYVEIKSNRHRGKYCWRIDIPADGDNYKYVRFTGPKLGVEGNYREHELCLGNIGADVRKYVREYQFDALVALLIEYLESNY